MSTLHIGDRILMEFLFVPTHAVSDAQETAGEAVDVLTPIDPAAEQLSIVCVYE